MKFRICFVLLILCFSFFSFSQDTCLLFKKNEIVAITIRLRLKEFLSDRSIESKYFDADVCLPGGQVLSAQIKTRGKYRNSESHCKYPPVMLRFNSNLTTGTIFEGIERLKVVTECSMPELIKRELFVYKAFGILTNFSFLTREAIIRFQDLSDSSICVESSAFFIEPVEALALRTRAKVLDFEMIQPDLLQPEQITRIYLFNYMVGNLDWDIETDKNLAFLYFNDSVYVVPYDFDFAAILYVQGQNEKMLLDKNPYHNMVLRRLCRSKKEYKNAVKEFRYHKKSMYKILNNIDIAKESKGFMKNYLFRYYFRMKNPVFLHRHLYKQCTPKN